MKTVQFTNLNRAERMQTLKNTEFDLVVIGGGITGAGIALDASSRGMKVALVDKGDFASGTSSKSTKLIHGGLRYLKQLDFALVRKVGLERAVVHNMAPHLVIPEKMLLPITLHTQFGELMTALGLKVYDVLAQVKKEDRRRMLNTDEALKMEPLLPDKITKSAAFYAEYRTDDARLTIENIKTSLQFGAVPINYTSVNEFVYGPDDQLSGIIVNDQPYDLTYKIKAKYVVNAAGPWVEDLLKRNTPQKKKHLSLTKGAHLVFPHEKLPVQHSIYFDIPDGRMLFAIPRGKVTYIGTTDTDFNGDKDEVSANREDAEYLLNGLNSMFPSAKLTLDDIISSWAGLRPLIYEEGKPSSELSRKDEIKISDNGLISILGGKLTGYRKMAEGLVDKLVTLINEKHERDLGESLTKEIKLAGGPYENYHEVENYIEEVHQKIIPLGLSYYDAWYLVSTYGRQTELILSKLEITDNTEIDISLAKAEFWFCVNYEMVLKPIDFFTRRTGRMYFDIDTVSKLTDPILHDFQIYFNASDEEISQYRMEIQREIFKCTDFK